MKNQTKDFINDSVSNRVCEITGQDITLDSLQMAVQEFNEGCRVIFKLSAAARKKMQTSREYIEKRISEGDVMYGVNTGFGAFASQRISDSEIELLQKNLIRSHSVGVGTPLTPKQSKAIMILRANTLARGHSGIRPCVVEKILEFLNHDIIPVIPSQGSVGASGDLAPLSHLALALIGEGEVWCEQNHSRLGNNTVSVEILLKEKKILPLELKAKEGLSLINGCQVMTAIGLLSLFEARRLLKLSDFAAALSLEVLLGSRKAFDIKISLARPHIGEQITAKNLRMILGETSEIGESHQGCHKVQDAYSLRCVPAVHGAVKDTLRQAISTLEIEANSSTDNPLVFAESSQILSCGNFHGMPIAFAMDYCSIALTSLMSICERRIAHLINPAVSELPAFVTEHGGLNSGHMITHVAAASLVSESKVLSHPASVDSIPTSADKEDHVSMGTIAARKFSNIVENLENVIAMEFLTAAQALDIRRPLKSSAGIEQMHQLIREKIPYAKNDRIFFKDIQKMRELLRDENILKRTRVSELEI